MLMALGDRVEALPDRGVERGDLDRVHVADLAGVLALARLHDEAALLTADLGLDEDDVPRQAGQRRPRRSRVVPEDLVDVHNLDAGLKRRPHSREELRPEDGLEDDPVVLLGLHQRLQLLELLVRVVLRVEDGDAPGAVRLGDSPGLR